MLASLVALPDDLFVLLRDRGAWVHDRKSHGAVTFGLQRDGYDIAFRGVVDGVVETIPEYLTELSRVGIDENGLFGRFKADPDSVSRGCCRAVGGFGFRKPCEIKGFRAELDIAGLKLGVV